MSREDIFKKAIRTEKKGPEALLEPSMTTNKPRLGNHVYFYDDGKLVMKIIPEDMTPEEVIRDYKRNRCKDIN